MIGVGRRGFMALVSRRGGDQLAVGDGVDDLLGLFLLLVAVVRLGVPGHAPPPGGPPPVTRPTPVPPAWAPTPVSPQMTSPSSQPMRSMSKNARWTSVA